MALLLVRTGGAAGQPDAPGRDGHMGTPRSVIAAASAAFGLTLAWRFLTFGGFSNDHYVHVALAQQVLLGDRPVRDFADQGWPLMYLLSAGAWRLAGDSLGVEWAIIAAGLGAGAGFTVLASHRLSTPVTIAFLLALLEILIYPRSYSYPKLLLYPVAAWASLALVARPSARRIVGMAAIIAVAFLFRHDHGIFIGLGAAASLAVRDRTDGWRRAAARVGLLTASSAAFLLPWLLFITLNGGVVSYLEGGFEYSRAEADATSLDRFPALELGEAVSTVANAEAWLFWLFWTVPLLSAVIVAVRAARRRETWPGEWAGVTGLVIVAILVNASFLRESLQVRIPDAIAPAAILGAWIGGLCWTGRWRMRPLQYSARAASIAVFIITLAAVARLSGFAALLDETDLTRGWGRAAEHARDIYQQLGTRHRDNRFPPSRVSTALMPFMSYVDRCTSPSDRLLVTGEFPELLVIAGRGFAGDGVVFGSWYASAARQDRTVGQLLRRPPLLVIHAGDYEGFASRFDLIDEFVNSGYEPMAEIPVEGSNSIRILSLRDRRSTRADSETGWRCYT